MSDQENDPELPVLEVKTEGTHVEKMCEDENHVLEQFMTISQCPTRERASTILDAATGQLQRALDIYFEDTDFLQLAPDSEEGQLSRAIGESMAVNLEKEPDVLTVFHKVSTSLPGKDPMVLRKLCEDYRGRSEELERHLEECGAELPTAAEGAKARLEAERQEMVAAGVEEAEQMVVEVCPACENPRMTVDLSLKVFLCPLPSCGLESCRSCWRPQHLPQPCSGADGLKDTIFRITRVHPQRHFEEDDPLSVQYRLAESQFARMHVQNKLQHKIVSIDVVCNPTLRTRFEAKRTELEIQGCGHSLLLFHGTPQDNIEPILRYLNSEPHLTFHHTGTGTTSI